jgi:hypothetical protein
LRQDIELSRTINGAHVTRQFAEFCLSGGNDMLRSVPFRAIALSVALLPLLSGCPATDTEIVTLRNDSGQNIHILGPGEDFGTGNRLTAGQSRTINLSPGTHTFRAGEGGNVFFTQACQVEEEFLVLTVSYTGTGLSCIHEPI